MKTMNDCDFKPGEVLEFSNKENFPADCTVRGELLAVKEVEGYSYWMLPLSGGRASAYVYKYIRRPLPDIKPGHPVMVYNEEFGIWELKVFKSFDKSDNSCHISICTYTRLFTSFVVHKWWSKWKLLDNYDYTKPPEIMV